MPFESTNLVAGGDIAPSTFVKLSAVADRTLLAGTANSANYGISREGAQVAPTPGASTLAASAGQQCGYYPIGSVCLLTAGSGGWAAGDELISDANGCGVPRATSGVVNQNVSAIAHEAVAAGSQGFVTIVRYVMMFAVS